MLKKFRGLLERDGTRLNWVVVRVPFDPAKTWKVPKPRRVQGTINGFPFRTSLFSGALGGSLLLVNKEMIRNGNVALGGTVAITLEPDQGERVATVPPELAKLLKQDRGLKRWFEALSYSNRKEIGSVISEPKSPDGRVHRAEQMAERMMLSMEGERELPPILERAFRREPQARAGWAAMTPAQRRCQLLGIFAYQSPESREKRAAKAVAAALKVAEKL